MNLRIAILGMRGIPNHYGGFENLAEHLAPCAESQGRARGIRVLNSHIHPYKGKTWKGVNIVHCYDPEYWAGTFEHIPPMISTASAMPVKGNMT